MNRYKPLWQLLTIEFLALTLVLSVYYFQLPIQCPFKWLTGIPCPGCGGTRALIAILHGHIIEAFLINPLSVLLIIFAIIAPVWLFIDCYRGVNSLQRVMKSKWNKTTICIVVIVVIANWIWNIIKNL